MCCRCSDRRLCGYLDGGSSKKRKYSRSSGSDAKNEMRRYKKGTAKSGHGGKGGKVKSRKQAIAIALSKARKKSAEKEVVRLIWRGH
ncbi:MAG TPA: DUF6496 domain-containing protein [Steroidobacteraceae bacterium]